MGAEVAASFERTANILAGATYSEICSCYTGLAVGRLRRALIFDGMVISDRIIEVKLDVGESLAGPWHNFFTVNTVANVGQAIVNAVGSVPIRIPGFYLRANYRNTDGVNPAASLYISGLLGVL